MHVKKDDIVQVISGARKKDIDKAKNGLVVGKILRVYPKTNRVVVEGVNMRKKHMKPTNEMKQAGIIELEGTINASNVLLYCDSCGKGVRTGYKMLADNKTKVRYCKKCGATLDK